MTEATTMISLLVTTIASNAISSQTTRPTLQKGSQSNRGFLAPERQSRQGSLQYQLCTPLSTIRRSWTLQRRLSRIV
eukprot:8749176-Pyramimonas_sp.AAC.1